MSSRAKKSSLRTYAPAQVMSPSSSYANATVQSGCRDKQDCPAKECSEAASSR